MRSLFSLNQELCEQFKFDSTNNPVFRHRQVFFLWQTSTLKVCVLCKKINRLYNTREDLLDNFDNCSSSFLFFIYVIFFSFYCTFRLIVDKINLLNNFVLTKGGHLVNYLCTPFADLALAECSALNTNFTAILRGVLPNKPNCLNITKSVIATKKLFF
jgi:hypothetical protein